MRKFFLSSMALIAMMGAMSLTSCSDDDNGEGGGGGGQTGEAAVLGGTLNEDLTLDARRNTS